MILNIATDWPLVDDYLEVLKGQLEEQQWKGDIYTVDSLSDAVGGPLIVVGAPHGFSDKALIHAPSVKETLGTAGGVTKLARALARALDPTQCAPLSWWFADQYPGGMPTWQGETLCADIEVGGDVDEDEPEDCELLCVSVSKRIDSDNVHAVVFNLEMLQQHEHRQALVDLLIGNTIIAHNGQFDFRWLNRQLADVLPHNLYPDEDTILMHHAIFPGAGVNKLKVLTTQIFGAPDWEGDIKKYTKGSKGHYERIPQDILANYNAQDVYWTLLLWEWLHALLKGTPQERLYYEHTLPASHMFQDVEQHAMWVDEDYLHMLDDVIGKQVEESLDNLRQLIRNPKFNPGSWQQVKKELLLYGKKVAKTDEKTLLSLRGYRDTSADVATFINALLEYRGLKKQHSTYVVSIIKKVRHSRVHASFLVFGTSTGRLSSRGPNLQNVPNDEEGQLSIRRVYGAAPGRLMFGCDYAQAELRTMAELANDELMIADLQRDSEDFFDNMLPHVFPKVDFTKLNKHERKPYRLKLKRTVYGCVPLSTRILTERGWSTHDEVRVGDLTMGINPKTGKSEWTEIKAVNHYGVQPIGRLGNARWGFDVTPGHKWLTFNRSGERKFKTTDKLSTEDNILVASSSPIINHQAKVPNFSLDEMRLISWLLSDGYLSIRPFTGRTAQGARGERRKVIASIQQAKTLYVTEIKELLAALGMDTRKPTVRPGVNYDEAYDWPLPTALVRDLLIRAGFMDRIEPGDDMNVDAELPSWLLGLPMEYIDVFLETFCKAEGHRRIAGDWIITQNPGGKLDAIEIAAVLMGFKVSRTKHGDKCMRLNLLSVPHVTNQTSKYICGGEQEVWCPTTELGTWTAQQADGRIAVTGNTSYGLTCVPISEMLTLMGAPTTPREAAAIQDGYLGRYEGLRAWREGVFPRVLDGDDLLTPFGRKFQQDVVTDKNKDRVRNQAWAFQPQSIASDICVSAALEIHKIFQAHPERDTHICASVHDAIYGDAPEEWAEWGAEVVDREMEASGARIYSRVPFLTDHKISRFWNGC